MRLPPRVVVAAPWLLITSLIGCKGGGTDPCPEDDPLCQPTAASISVTPGTVTLDAASGSEQQFSAVARTAGGTPLSIQPTFTWVSTNPDVATVSTSGLASALAHGTTDIEASASGITGSATLTVTGAASATESSIVAGATSIQASSGGTTVAITVTARDALGRPVPGVTVALNVSGSDNMVIQPSAVTDADGEATGALSSTKAEEKRITATIAGSVFPMDTAVVTVTAAAADVISSVAGDAQIGTVNERLPVDPAVLVEDEFGNPVSGTVVAFAVSDGDGSLSASTATTGALGQASVEWTAGIARDQGLQASVAGLTGSPVTFSAQAYFQGTGAPTIDGVLQPGEWDGAACVAFNANIPEGGTTPATQCMMNDGTNVYFLLRYTRPTDRKSVVWLYFDVNDDGNSSTCGDDIVGVARALDSTVGTFTDWQWFDSGGDPGCSALASGQDVSRGGATNGSGAYGHSGSEGFVELAHPFSSGDVLDIDLALGDAMGVTGVVQLYDVATGSSLSTTFAPYVTMRITTGPFPASAAPARTIAPGVAGESIGSVLPPPPPASSGRSPGR